MDLAFFNEGNKRYSVPIAIGKADRAATAIEAGTCPDDLAYRMTIFDLRLDASTPFIEVKWLGGF
jgi:hypothetical protein